MQSQPYSSASSFEWSRFRVAGGVAAFVFLAYSVATILQINILGGYPSSALEAFQILQQNRIVGLLRLDLATVLVLPFYYPLFFGLFVALKDSDRTNAATATGLVFIGLTLVLAMPTALPLAGLSDKYAAANSEAAKALYLAAGEAVINTDIWHGTGAYVGGMLLQTGAVLISVVMLRGVFSKFTAWAGIIIHGLDGVHILLTPFLPKFAALFMIVAGLGYPIWLWLVGRRLLQIGKARNQG